MNIDNYKTFLILSRINNYSKTAEKLNVVQSTVSSRINELEKYLNVELFKRSKRKIEITDAGKALIPYAKKIVHTEQEGMKSIQRIGMFKDCLSIGIPNSVFSQQISPMIYEYYERYPQYTIDARFHKTVQHLELLMNDELDMGFISRIPNTNKLMVKPYLNYSWILVASVNYQIPKAIEVADLGAIDLCYNNQNAEYNEWLQDVLPKNFRTRMNMNSTMQLIQYVKQGRGCAFLPSYAIKEDVKNGVLKVIKINNVRPNKFKIYLAVNKKRMDTDAVKKFIELL